MKRLLLLLFACCTLQAASAQRIPFDSTNNSRQGSQLESLLPGTKGDPSDPRSKLRHSLFLLEQEFLRAEQEGVLPGAFVSSQAIIMIQNGMVRIQAVAEKDAMLLITELERLGATQVDYMDRTINAWFPIGKISELPYLKGLQFVKPVYWVKGDIGAADSEGDLALQAIAARQNYCVNGAGVRVGVLSDSYDFLGGAAAGVTSGDLPGPGNPNGFTTAVTNVADAGNSDEGRAMIEIVHDLAPGAQLFFNTANGGEASFANAILNLDAVRNCDVIVDDIRYFEEPFYMDGLVAQACNTVFSNGVAYFASAGNYGQLSYESEFRDDGSGDHDFDPGAGVDTRQSITVNAGSTINLTLQWDDPWGSITPNSAATDLDVRLYNASNTLVAFSTDFNIIGGDPTEFFSYTDPNGAGTATYTIRIDRFAGPAPAVLKWVIRNSNGLVINEYPPTTVNARATGYGHSNATGANAVGAAFWGNTPAYGVNPPQPEGFTSNGGVQIRYNTNGVPITPVTRNKPNFTAVDGTSNTFFGNGNNFFGTSAAAPHAAAVAALMLEANSTLSPTDVRNLLVASSIDMLTPGFDFTTGAGLIQADVAVREAIELQCNITGITVQGGGPACIAGQGTYSVTLRISYTNPPACNDILWVNGQEFAANGATFQDVTLTGLNPNGLPVSVTAYFKSAPGCSATATNLFTAPQKPTITCPGAQQLVLGPNCSAPLPNYIPMATVNSPAPGTVVTQAPPAGTVVSNTGAMNVTITVTDDCGSTSCTFMVTKVDNTPPTVMCSNSSVTFNGENSIPLNSNDFVTASDNCDTPIITLSPNAINCIQLGQIVPVTVTVKDLSNNSSVCVSQITVGGLPCGWSSNSGSVGCGSSVTYAPPTGVWSMNASSCYYANPYTNDAVAFAQRQLCGNGSITARVTNIGGIGGWAGVTMRESNALGAKKVQLMTNLSNFIRAEVRYTTGGQAYPADLFSFQRFWVRIAREGNEFTGFVSSDGNLWIQTFSVPVPMNSCIQVGLVMTNFLPNGAGTATFDNVVAIGSNVPPLVGAGSIAEATPAAWIEQPHGFEVYPNPTSGELNVDLTHYLNRAARIEVYNLQGQLLQFTEIDEVQTTLERVDLSAYQKGMYLVRLKSAGLPDVTRRVVLSGIHRP